MTTNTHVGMIRTVATPVEVGVKHIRWGLGLFIFGLVVGYIPLAHYMHGSFEPVGEAFLKNVTLWWVVRLRWRSMSRRSAALP